MDASNLWPTDITKVLFSSFLVLFQACNATSSSCQSPLQQVNWSLGTDMASLELTTFSSWWTPLLSCQCVLESLSCCMMKDLPISLIVCFWNWQIKSFCILLSQFCCLINRWMSLLMSQKKLCRTPIERPGWNFAIKYRDEPQTFWDKVSWTDETSVQPHFTKVVERVNLLTIPNIYAHLWYTLEVMSWLLLRHTHSSVNTVAKLT